LERGVGRQKFTSIEPEIGIRIVTNKNNDKLQGTGLYLSKCKKRWKRSVKNMRKNKYKK
jgi:hypothetical protein